MDRFTITTPIFYVNAPPHIGHAYTVVAADVLARAHRLRGDDPTSSRQEAGLRGAGVFFLTGTDEHGAKIAEAAAAQGKSPQAFVDEIAAAYKNTWNALDVQYDDFIRTTEPRHESGVKLALQTLHDRGLLYEKSYHGLYCTGCEKFLTEKDLDADGKCPLHNRAPTEVEEKNWFFKLSGFLPKIQEAIEANTLRIRPDERRNEVLGLLRGSGVEDFSISRPKERVPWAIPLPFDSSQTCYVWVDALLNYVTALGYGENPHAPWPTAHARGEYWPADVQLIGQDILKFHAVYWPALLLALDLPLPREIFVHGFFTVNGQKISKSLYGEQGRTIGNAIDPLALVKRYGSDATRYLLLSQFPFGASGDVQAARFDEQYDAILANTIGNLVSRTVTLVQKFSDSKVPDAPPNPPAVGEGLRALPNDVALSLDSLVRAPVELAQELNRYADRTAPWKETDVTKRAAALRTLTDGVVRLSLVAEPLLPTTSAAIEKAFGIQNRQLPAPGTPVAPTDPPILFPRLT